eukprot:6146828-Pyramimonas_sp.AAC.1
MLHESVAGLSHMERVLLCRQLRLKYTGAVLVYRREHPVWDCLLLRLVIHPSKACQGQPPPKLALSHSAQQGPAHRVMSHCVEVPHVWVGAHRANVKPVPLLCAQAA